MTAATVELAGLRFGWGIADLLHIDSLRIAAGESVFMYGPSGCGKSTLLNLIAGVLLPRAGTVSILGQRSDHLAAAARDRLRAEHIGYIFQQFNLIPYLSMVDNVVLPCRFAPSRRQRAGGTRAAVLATARGILARLDLTDPALLRRAVSALSIGQQQRVAAARALIGGPELIIADEPTSALDETRRITFLDLLLRERAGAALLFVSHDLRLAERFDRVLRLDQLNAAAGNA
jgi:putative ABC transport system ATP-binding protein